MSTYKITNMTNLTGKRDFKHNSVLDIEYVDNMVKKTIQVKPGDSVYLTVPTLPLSVHRLRVKGLIVVTEISEAELVSVMNAAKPKAQKKTVEEEKKLMASKKLTTSISKKK